MLTQAPSLFVVNLSSVRASTALGALAVAGLLALGQPAQAQECLLDTNGDGNADTDIDTIAGASATGVNSLACGPGAEARGDRAVAIGEDAEAEGDDSIAIGAATDASGVQSIAIGSVRAGGGVETTAAGDGSIALGSNAFAGADANFGIAIGADADDGGGGAGRGASVSGFGAIAIGADSTASEAGAIALGADGTDPDTLGAIASGANAVAIGADATATDFNAVAIGNGAVASGGGSTALGPLSSATHDGSTALGASATTTRSDQVMIGTGFNTYTLPGLTSGLSTAAQSGPTALVTTDAAGNLASDGGSTFASIAANGRDIRRNKEGIAMAMAMDAPYVPLSSTFAMSGRYGNFEGASAVSLSGAVRVSPAVQIDAGLAYGVNHNNLGGTVGITMNW